YGWGSGSSGIGARTPRPRWWPSERGAARSGASATWCGAPLPSSNAPRSSNWWGWEGATAFGSPGASCCGRGDCGVRPLQRAGARGSVVVRAGVYVEHRTAVRGEPLLWVRGKLAKDDGTVNVIAEEAKGLQIYRGSRIADCGLEDPLVESAIRNPQSEMAFLKTFRRVAPESKDWG